ncbi:receptor-type tyrosine-protein phosphatase epsilon-like isoform X2 [Argopecten irradians]|uniref:receptor-type tyrosine-protein phosphatase epsilon-like isoform X2 n=1 Tax=Argopecten irradians TaxID=31199 RepID=UPI0037109013
MAGHTYLLLVGICGYLNGIETSEILSGNKPTVQSSNYRFDDHSPITYTSANAVDGNTNQLLRQKSCAHQAEGQSEAWWRVDLQKQVTIDNIEIYYRDEGVTGWTGWRNRFAGYEVYLSNTTERRGEDRCFVDSSQEVDGILSHVNLPGCKGTAQYVTVYNHRETPKRQPWYSDFVQLELCEVQVYGCEVGTYGNGNCDQTCSPNCPDGLCDPTDGHCIYCGINTYMRSDESVCRPCPDNCAGPCSSLGLCNEGCVDGTHGDRCELKCPDNCGTDVCDRDSGECKDGCVDGTYGDRCELECSENCTSCTQDGKQCLGCIDGAFGSSCSKTCGNCEDMRCSLDTGDCDTPCLTGWVGQQCDVKVFTQSGNTDNIGVYAGGAGGVAVFVLLVIAIVCVIKRKSTISSRNTSVIYERPNYLNRGADDEIEHVYLDIQSDSLTDGTVGRDNIYYNEGPIDFPVTKLKALISEKIKHDKKQFIAEFESLPHGAIHHHTVSDGNSSKNRFQSIHPYDHSRVILDVVPGGNCSNYINASYIDGIDENSLYVATQGPLRSTIDDFWRMTWILNCGKIVMLTNLVEGQKEKCAKYWPDEGDPISTKTFQITLNRERHYASQVVRNITITDRKSKETREITQLHFTSWPDHGTPNALELVLFHRRVKLCHTRLPGQMVIHCSGGVDRTGLFIALDALLDFGRKHQHINIRSYVNKMRKNRMNMIQTVDNYVALHEILVEAFDLQDTLIPKSIFLSKWHTLSTVNKTQLRDEFKLMLDRKPERNSEQDFLAATLPENMAKNRTMRILAVDEFRASLQSSGNDYINAVVVPSYTDIKGFIVTQTPLPDTRADLWTLVMDCQCDTIVILGDDKDPDQDNPWIPMDITEITMSNFTITQTGIQTNLDNVDIVDLLIKRKCTKTAHKTQVFHVKEWTMDRQVPPSKQLILHLLEKIERRRRASGNKPVLVSCRDGATQCGLFCLMANTRDQLKMDEEVDVFQTALQLLVRRPEFFSTFEQYHYCFTILTACLQETDVYVN